MFSTRLTKLGVVCTYLLGLVPFWGFAVDDAFISYVYARNLAIGNGLTYNGAIVEGYSNPLWTLLLSPFVRLGINPLVVARSLSLAAGVLSLLVLVQLASRLSPGRSLGAFMGAASVAVLSPFAAWTIGGLETVFLAAQIMLLVRAEWDGPPSARWTSPILLLAISLTRPEGFLVFCVWTLHRYLQNTSGLRGLALEASLFAVPYMGFIAWRWNTYGYPLPNTAYLKLGPTLQSSLEAGEWLLGFFALRPLFALALLVGLMFVLLKRATRKEWRLSAGIVLGFFVFVIIAGRDWMPHHRFLAPIVPLLGLPIAYTIDATEQRGIKLAMIGLAAGAIVVELALGFTLYRPLTRDFARYTDGLIEAGRWIEKNTTEGATIAVVDAGALAYYGERKTIDILGLNNTHVAHSDQSTSIDYVMSHDPAVIQLHVGFSETGQLHAPTDGKHNQLIVDHPGFRRCYSPDLGRPDDPYYPYLFLRNCP